MDALVYQYLVGGVVFVIGLVYAARQGYVGFSGRPLMNLTLLVGGFLFFLLLQGALQYAPMTELEPKPFAGDWQRKPTLGTGLDYAIMIGYFAAILAIGTWFSRRRRTIKDFFFAGRRFSWWLITFSLIATTVGSYSFVKYSRAAYQFGTGSTQSYLNDWFWVPLMVFGWLPILYFSRITSIPEYFERRFNRRVRIAVTGLILVYLVSYVGVNLFTMGQALQTLLGWEVLGWAVIVASISAIYVTAGGQTSVVMTDLFQGVMLLATGIVILVLGAIELGGFGNLWDYLPRGQRLAFPNFNEDPSFPSVGIFWQDGIANTAMFYFLNQGIVMRFMSVRSVRDGRKAMYAMVLILMPIATIVVGAGGWVAKSLVQGGELPADGFSAKDAFFVAAEFLARPGVFGLVLAALTAALMSTVDTLITAVAAIIVNDVYQPYVNPQASDREMLGVARWTSISVTLVGLVLVPVFMGFNTIIEAHGAMTAAVAPPLVVALLLSVFWKRFTAKAAFWTVVGGALAILFSIFVPEVIRPFAHGVPPDTSGEGLFAGMKQWKFMRGCYGICVSAVIGVVMTFVSKPAPEEQQDGLVWGTAGGVETKPRRAFAVPRALSEEPASENGLAVVEVSSGLASALDVGVGDHLYVTDRRWWTGGLRSMHATIRHVFDDDDPVVGLGTDSHDLVVAKGRASEPVRVEFESDDG